MAKYIESLMLNGVQYYIDTEWVSPIDTPWIYHNSDLWLISLSSDGSNWITIADKNLWATQVYNDGDTLSEANSGKYYQWWNNYGFPFTWATSRSSTKVNASSYWPWNYYSSSTFITSSASSDAYWDSSSNSDLRWWTTWTNVAMQWPCDTWFHIPSKDNFESLLTVMSSLSLSDLSYLKIPNTWYLHWDWVTRNSTTEIFLFTSTRNSWLYAYTYRWYNNTVTTRYSWYWTPIRPFKNEAVQPDDSRTKLY